MLTVCSGRFEDLESALLQRLRELKEDPWAPVLIVAPSSRLSDHLHRVLAGAGLSALNLHFHSFSSLAESVVAEEGPLPKPVLSDPLFFDTLVRIILKDDRPFPGMADLAVPDGFPPSVRGTLRDLLDSGVDPDKLQEAVDNREEFRINAVDVGTLKQLLQLYRLYLRRIAKLPVLPRASLLEMAIARAPGSPYLKRFREVIYYGFYDLTGQQADFFHAVTESHPSRFYFPYVHGHPDFSFAARFRDDVLQKAHHEEDRLAPVFDPASPPPPPGPDAISIQSVSGLRDEAWTVAAEILRLHEKDKIPYSQMAVISRHRERLLSFEPAFRERAIPFVSSAGGTLVRAPQVEVGLRFLETIAGVAAVDPDADFLRFPDFELPVGAEAFSVSDPWPEQDGWGAYARRSREALDGYFSSRSEESAATWNALKEGLRVIERHFDALGSTVKRSDFLEAVRERWMRTPVPGQSANRAGVQLLHAEAARGLSFQTVFFVGLEERVFPRIVREDPFLRDNARRAIFDTIGNKIGQKLTALMEERLLFHLIVQSARTSLFLLYQRSDDEGKVVGPSGFLRQFAHDRGLEFATAVRAMPRPLGDKLKEAGPEMLGVRDAFVHYFLRGRSADAIELAAALHRDAAGLRRGLDALTSLGRFDKPGERDGLVNEALALREVGRRPLSPSALETFGRCPFQFFVTRVLGVRPLEEPASPEALEGKIRGKMVHRFLQAFFQKMTEAHPKGWPATVPEPLFDEAFSAAFDPAPPALYPLLWETVKVLLRAQLWDTMTKDFAKTNAAGFRPSFFEQPVSGSLPPPLDGIVWTGIIDRIDLKEGQARVIDYKTGAPSRTKVATRIVQGRKMQPPLYLLLGQRFLAGEGKKVESLDFSYLHVGEEQPRIDFSSDDWARNRASALTTIQALLRAMRSGWFPILPDTYCSYCDVASVCRRNDSLSAYRSAQGPARELAALRKKRGAT